MLTDRWTQLEDHAEQRRLVASAARFKVVAAGRRSGKTECAKRKLVLSAMDPPRVHRPTFIAAAPTRDQAKRIWWTDLKELSPKQWIASVSESELTIEYRSGARLVVVGLDKPQRIEGIAIDGAVMDEYAECRPEAWSQSLRPALSTRDRPGWCWFTGRPKGRNHFYRLWSDAKVLDGWDSFHWASATILAPEEVESARRDLDPLTFRQEYEADFVSFEGLAYYQWDANLNLRRLDYNPALPLVFCFDFNVDPGVAVILQEQDFPADVRYGHKDPFKATAVLGEVWIERNSNTPAVCRKLAADWAHHKGPIHYYGDPAGKQRRTSGILGTDWDLVRDYLRESFHDLHNRVARAAPLQRDRINSVNTRLRSADGRVRLFVDPTKAPHVVRDFEGVTLLQGGSGELDKQRNPELSHLTDGLGYYIHDRYPIGGSKMKVF